MSEVRVRLQMGTVHLEFRGEEGVFERAVDPLLLDLARGTPLRRARRSPVSGNGQPDGTSATGAPASTPEAPVEEVGYQPPLDRFGTFQRQLDPEQNGTANRVAAFAFFLWNYEKKEVFSEEEVTGCFRAAGHVPPEDASEIYSHLVQKRIVEPGGDDCMWRLTPKGLAHVRHHLLSA